MNKDQFEGRVMQAAGLIREIVGKALDDKRLQDLGKTQKVAGELRASYGDLKHSLRKSY